MGSIHPSVYRIDVDVSSMENACWQIVEVDEILQKNLSFLLYF